MPKSRRCSARSEARWWRLNSAAAFTTVEERKHGAPAASIAGASSFFSEPSPARPSGSRIMRAAADVAKLAYAQDLGSCGETRAGSSPAVRNPATARRPSRVGAGILPAGGRNARFFSGSRAAREPSPKRRLQSPADPRPAYNPSDPVRGARGRALRSEGERNELMFNRISKWSALAALSSGGIVLASGCVTDQVLATIGFAFRIVDVWV